MPEPSRVRFLATYAHISSSSDANPRRCTSSSARQSRPRRALGGGAATPPDLLARGQVPFFSSLMTVVGLTCNTRAVSRLGNHRSPHFDWGLSSSMRGYHIHSSETPSTELQSFRLCGLPEDSVLFRPTGHTGRSVSRCGLTALLHGHHASTCASAASVSGSQKVISISRYIAIAVDNAARACSCWPIVAYSVPKPRWQWAWSGRMPSSSARARARQ